MKKIFLISTAIFFLNCSSTKDKLMAIKPSVSDENVEIKIVEIYKQNSYTSGNYTITPKNSAYELLVLEASILNKYNNEIIISMAPETIDPSDNKTIILPSRLDYCCSWFEKSLGPWKSILQIESVPLLEDLTLDKEDSILRTFVFAYPRNNNPTSFKFSIKTTKDTPFKSIDVKITPP